MQNNIEQIVLKQYERFQDYMKITDMENIVVRIKPEYEMGYALAQTIKNDDIRYLDLHQGFADDILRLDDKVEAWKIGVLFHEFTHIADDKILADNHVPKTKQYVCSPYLEYHAEFIKNLYLFGIIPFSKDKMSINYNDRFDTQYKTVTAYEYVMKTKDGYAQDIDSCKLGDMSCFMKYYNMLSYYLGTASAYNICCRYKKMKY